MYQQEEILVFSHTKTLDYFKANIVNFGAILNLINSELAAELK